MTKQYTIKELYELLKVLIDDGYGDKEFQIYYDSETVYTTIPKGSIIELNNKGVRFTDYDDGTCHIDDWEIVDTTLEDEKGVRRMKDYNRISCPACNYPMRVLSYENGLYQCYCAECKMDRYVKKELEE